MPDPRLVWLAAALCALSALFLCWNLQAPVAFIFELRAVKLAGLVVVGIAIGVSTVLFQTLSGNRVLTPAIMGFDALFLLTQTGLVFFLGGLGYAYLPATSLFAVNTIAMLFASVALFSFVLRGTRQDIHLMILVGVVFGLLFRSLTSFMQRLIDPSEFAVVQAVMFAQFGAINTVELTCAGVLLIALGIWIARKCAVLDVMSLGRTQARQLGLHYDRLQFQLLCAISAMVSVSTALVGPITFLGLLVSALAHSLMRSHRHALLLPAAALIAAIVLVAGQALFERLLSYQSTLAVVIEFVGGLLFLMLLTLGKVR